MAADLLSQAEHDELASAILVTTSMELAEKVSAQTDAFIKELSRGEIIQKSLDHYGHILVADTLEDAIDAANSVASEHLEIVTANPFEVMTKIRNAGAIFIGEYSSEPLGDYFAVVPLDNAYWCQCDECQKQLAIDEGNIRGEHFNCGTATHYLWTFVNNVAKEVKKTHPDKKIAALSYHVYAYLPKDIQLEDNTIRECAELTK